mmetsp:Transcript_16487/g.29908  ORF Transcript_16487/g.29908 Transcript_16487/m.29908 type:complete len:100 (-) Transcript_16487:633-932(-)
MSPGLRKLDQSHFACCSLPYLWWVSFHKHENGRHGNHTFPHSMAPSTLHRYMVAKLPSVVGTTHTTMTDPFHFHAGIFASLNHGIVSGNNGKSSPTFLK